jgi:hypothetical protein
MPSQFLLENKTTQPFLTGRPTEENVTAYGLPAAWILDEPPAFQFSSLFLFVCVLFRFKVVFQIIPTAHRKELVNMY